VKQPSDAARALAAEMFAIFVHPAPTVGMLEQRMGAIERAQQAADTALAKAWDDGWASGVEDEQQSATYSERRSKNPHGEVPT
jgi:phage-related minor tail protein